MEKLLNVRHFSQLDNRHHPSGTCNLTCVAMCLDYFKVRPKQPGKQLEDELFEYVYSKKLSRHSPEDLAKVVRAYGCKDRFTWYATIEEVIAWIDQGNPCILHGMFTRSGHIVVARGYKPGKLIVNDPNGEYFRNGYDITASGAGLEYSFGLIQETCAYDGEFWVHFISA
ncbi:C39 family peptidase [Microcoleus sp. AT9b-C3]|uniref:C39 family peptidase n=1 Tax=Microcoleus sp. AT9b-C3 TaxID=2818629 RepID=UPI002FCF8A61